MTDAHAAAVDRPTALREGEELELERLVPFLGRALGLESSQAGHPDVADRTGQCGDPAEQSNPSGPSLQTVPRQLSGQTAPSQPGSSRHGGPGGQQEGRLEERPPLRVVTCMAPSRCGGHHRTVVFEDAPQGPSRACLDCCRQALLSRGDGWWVTTPCLLISHTGGKFRRLVQLEPAEDHGLKTTV